MKGSLSPITDCVPQLIATATLVIDTSGSSFAEITREVMRFVAESRAKDGALFLFARHTSASLVIQENADPDVRSDLASGLDRLAPASAGWIHDTEGPDDMPAHVKTMLTGVSLHVPVIGGALREAVSGLFEDVEIAEAGSFDDVTKLLERGAEVDLILLDLAMPGVRGFSGLMYLRAQYPSVPIVVVSANDDPAVIRRCMDFGALGFIPKTLGIEIMRGAITRVFEGGVWTPPDVDLGAGADVETTDLLTRLTSLTPQQVRVLMMLSEGLLNKQIAYELGVSEATVKAHVSAILQKLGVESRTQAVIAASKIELGQWPQPVGAGH